MTTNKEPNRSAHSIICELCYRTIYSGEYINDEEVKNKSLEKYYNEPSFQCLVKSLNQIFETQERQLATAMAVIKQTEGELKQLQGRSELNPQSKPKERLKRNEKSRRMDKILRPKHK